MKIALINGCNINLLGKREPEHYGAMTLTQMQANLQTMADAADMELVDKQSNHEGVLIDYVQSLQGNTDYIIINPAAFTHTSIGLRDALLAVAIPFIEVHISNVYQRESFRHQSYFSDIAIGSIVGLGITGYQLALQFIINHNGEKHVN